MRFLIVLFGNVAALLAIGIAGYLAFCGKDGWGWFLFVGVLTIQSFEFGGKPKENKNEAC